MKIINISSILLFAICIAGCGETRDASIEEPVTMQAGNYKVTFSAAGMMGLATKGPGNSSRDICVGSDEIGSFPTNFARNYFSMDDSCNLIDSDRVGNRISGTFSCPFDPNASDGSFVAKYNGEITEKALSFEYSMTIDMDAEMTPEMTEAAKTINNLKGRAKAERTGKCSDNASQSSNDDSYESDDHEDYGSGDDSNW